MIQRVISGDHTAVVHSMDGSSVVHQETTYSFVHFIACHWKGAL